MSPRAALPLLAGALLLLPGCFYEPAWDASSGSPLLASEADAAQANVFAAIPALEAYYADNGTYAGASLEILRTRYDRSIADVTLVGPLDESAYCLESTVGSATFSKNGPLAEIVARPCGAPPAATDAGDAVLKVVPSVEAYREEHGSYRGIQRADEVYGVSLGDVRIAVLKKGTAYCIEAPRRAPSAHYVGPAGPLADGPC